MNMLIGEIVEIGMLEEYCEYGLVVRLDDGRLITIKGFSLEECRSYAQLFCERVSVTISAQQE